MPSNPESQKKPHKKKQSDQSKKSQAKNDGYQSEPAKVVNEIKRMPPDKREAVYSAIFSGPIPPASELKAYEDVVEGAANRIIKIAEGEAEHRRKQEEKMVNSSCGDSRLGLWLGFFMGLASLALSGAIAIFASPTAGSILAFASISSLVGVFVYGSRQKKGISETDEQSK